MDSIRSNTNQSSDSNRETSFKNLDRLWKVFAPDLHDGISHGVALVRVPNCKAESAFSVLRQGSPGNLVRHVLPPEKGPLLSDNLPGPYVWSRDRKSIWFKIRINRYPHPTPPYLPGGMTFNSLVTDAFVLTPLGKGRGSGFMVRCHKNSSKDLDSELQSPALIEGLARLPVLEWRSFQLVPWTEVETRSAPATVVRLPEQPFDEESLIAHDTLGALRMHLDFLIAEYGEEAKIDFDAGYNNINVKITPVVG